MASAEDRDNGEVIGTEVEVLVWEVHTWAISRAAPFEVGAEVLDLSPQTLRRHPPGGTSWPAHRETTTWPEISKGLELQMRAHRENRSPVTPFLPITDADFDACGSTDHNAICCPQ